MRRERELLMHHEHSSIASVARTRGSIGFAVEKERSVIGKKNTGEHVHERALPRPVLADERAHFTRRNRKIDAVHGERGTETLPYPFRFETLQFNHLSTSGRRSSCILGSFMLSLVTRVTPVSMRFSIGSPRRCATIVLTPR